MNKEVWAFIPARSGSERFKNKNIKSIMGKNLIQHAVSIAKGCNSITKIIVSSDSDEYLKTVVSQNVVLHRRPKSFSGNKSTISAAMQNFFENLISIPDAVILLQPTQPQRTVHLLESAINNFFLIADDYDSLVSVSKTRDKIGIIEDNCFIPKTYSFESRSQDLEMYYKENGVFYISKIENILKGELFGRKVYPYEVDEIFGLIDIDTELDFKISEIVYTYMLDKGVL